MMNTSDSFSPEKRLNEFNGLLLSRARDLSYYSPYSFLRTISHERLSRETFTEPLIGSVASGRSSLSAEFRAGKTTWFVWRDLPWDSDYFRRRVVRIELIISDHEDADAVAVAVNRFLGRFTSPGDYVSMTVPCEDLLLLRGLAGTGFMLVETRLNYYFTGFESAQSPLLPVRMAVADDIPVLRDVAMRMRNRFDRVHADPAFTEEEADSYLGTFAEQSVRGFADMVAVPDLPGVKPFGFLAAGNPERIMDLNIAKLVLAAVDNSEHRGWMFHLLGGIIRELKMKNTDILTTITQASNKPAIRTWEKAGFLLGFVTHVYSYSNK